MSSVAPALAPTNIISIILIGKNLQTGKTERLEEGFRYHDTYTKKNGTWQIAVRESEVLWAKTETIE